MQNKKYFILFYILITFVYLFFAAASINKPIIGFQSFVWFDAINVVNGGKIQTFFHPPLYTYLVSLSFKIFGISEFSAKLPGLFCMIIMPFLIYKICKLISKNHHSTALIALLLFLTSPYVIQGSLLIDYSDTTLLPLAITLFYLVLLKTRQYKMPYRIILSGIAFCFCLMSKITTSLAIPVSVFIYYLPTKSKRNLVFSIGFTFVGLFLFSLSILFYSYLCGQLYHSLDYFSYILGAAGGQQSIFFNIYVLIKTSIVQSSRLIIWISPIFTLFAIIAALSSIRNFFITKSIEIKEHFLIFSLIVLAIYKLIIPANVSGFPKYDAVIMPVLSCYIAEFLSSKLIFFQHNIKISSGMLIRNCKIICGIVFISAVFYNIIFVGDTILCLSLLRDLQFYNGMSNTLIPIVSCFILYLLFPVVIILISKSYFKKSYLLNILFIYLLATNISMNSIQAVSNYSTIYSYGARGLKQLKKFLTAQPDKTIFCSRECIIANIPDKIFHDISGTYWNNPDLLINYLKLHNPSILVYGLPCNTIQQMHIISESLLIKEYFDANFNKTIIGSYIVCIKKDAK